MVYAAGVSTASKPLLYNESVRNIRINILEILHKAQASHLGSSMSIVEILTAMYSVASIDKIISHADDRDRIIVSKGHAAAATYAVMHEFGLLDRKDLLSYHHKGSKLQGHVSHGVKYVEHSTGALGHGLSVGVGHAIYLKNQGINAKTMVLCGDGEIQEGSIWEALMLASTRKLNGLVVLVDVNGISSIKNTEEVISTGELRKRFEGFGLYVIEVDGHDVSAIREAILTYQDNQQPLVVLCQTIKGKGVQFAEGEAIWHYRSLSSEAYNQAMEELL